MNDEVGKRLSTEERLKAKPQKVDKLRYAEYYGQQETLDRLYKESLEGRTFNKLYQLIVSDSNIIMAYRNIKKNPGSKTPGSDGKTIKDIEKLSTEEVCTKVRNILNNYQPRRVRRKEIPKPNGSTRPLGIP